MSTVERVTYRPEGERARSIYLQDPRVSGDVDGPLGEVLVGVELDREGVRVGTETVSARQHVISLELVSKRIPVRMDNYTGVFVPTT